MPLDKYGIFSPVLGIKNDFPTILLSEGYVMTDLPDTKDVLFHNGKVVAAKKRLKAWDQAMPDPILHDTEYRKRDNTKFEIVCTKRDVAYRDGANDRLVYITPKYAAGKVRVENASAKIYGGLEVDNCDDAVVAWADGSGGNVTPSRQTASPKDGSAFVRLTSGAGAAAGLLAYHNISSIDLTAYDSIGFWIRSSVPTNSGDLQFLLDDTAACASPLETINIQALTANTWTWINIPFADATLLTAVVSIGIKQAVDIGAATIDIDQIVAGDWSDKLKSGDFITLGTTYSTDDTWYQVSSVDSDTEVTLTAVYGGSTASQQAYQARQTYTGTNNDYWQSVTFNDKWIATNNGKAKIQSWAGTGQCADLTNAPKCRYLTEYENYLLAGSIIDGSGNSFPQTYQWPAIGDETAWSTGDAGEASIPGSSQIRGFSPGTVEGYKIIGTTGAIYRLHVVAGDEVFRRELVTQDIGIVSPYSMINYDRGVFAFCSDNTFRKITISSWEIVSKEVSEILRRLAFAYKENIQGVFNVEYGLLMWLIPNKDSNGKLNQILTYDLDDGGAWGTIQQIGYCFGTSIPESAVTWDTLPFATWQTWGWEQWDTFSQTANYIMTNISDDSGYLYRMFQSEQDNGAEYVRSFVLGSDFEGQRGLSRFKRLLKIEAFFDSEVTAPKTISCQVKADKEAAWQDTQDGAAKSIVNTSYGFTVVEFFFDDIKLGRHFLMKFFAENAFAFLGMIAYFDKGYGGRPR